MQWASDLESQYALLAASYKAQDELTIQQFDAYLAALADGEITEDDIYDSANGEVNGDLYDAIVALYETDQIALAPLAAVTAQAFTTMSEKNDVAAMEILLAHSYLPTGRLGGTQQPGIGTLVEFKAAKFLSALYEADSMLFTENDSGENNWKQLAGVKLLESALAFGDNNGSVWSKDFDGRPSLDISTLQKEGISAGVYSLELNSEIHLNDTAVVVVDPESGEAIGMSSYEESTFASGPASQAKLILAYKENNEELNGYSLYTTVGDFAVDSLVDQSIDLIASSVTKMGGPISAGLSLIVGIASDHADSVADQKRAEQVNNALAQGASFADNDLIKDLGPLILDLGGHESPTIEIGTDREETGRTTNNQRMPHEFEDTHVPPEKWDRIDKAAQAYTLETGNKYSAQEFFDDMASSGDSESQDVFLDWAKAPMNLVNARSGKDELPTATNYFYAVMSEGD